MGNKRFLLVFICLTSFLQNSNGQCLISGGISLGPVPHHEFIQDVFRGIIRNETTTNIERIASISYGGALVGSQPYLDITHEDSQFIVQTTDAFAQYEEFETAESISVTINFSCTGGNNSPLILVINIEDTNNNYPEFVPTDEFEFVLTPPLPPGYHITGCLHEITVKDIDLTTRSIIFEIEDNPYLEIEYDEAASVAAGAKLFKALLKTSTFIRTLREPITLRITATDVDATGDPPLTTSGTIRISGDTEFEFPEEPVFSQTFYFATYTDEHQLIQHDTISLQQGFDEYVNFTLDGDYKDYFTTNSDGNQVSLVVSTLLPIEVWLEKQIYLIVRAYREYTSGDSATIVIHLPEETPLMFENAVYEGSIIDNALQLSPLVLSQGYDGVTVSARIDGEHLSSFTAIVQGNLITIAMDPLTDDIIRNTSFISLPVVASTNRNEATTIVSLEIIKDDTVTPVFDESIYIGTYDPVNGLAVDQINFVQGFDDTVYVELLGEHRDLFQTHHLESTIHLTTEVIPPELYEEQQITLLIKATKPRTVGANAAIIITLPAARVLDFEEPIYRGTIQDSELLLQTILLSDGFDENVRFTLSGDYSTYFNVTNIQNQVDITLLEPLPDIAIAQNTVIALTITASGLNAIRTTTSVLLHIIKEDTTTPVLSQRIYHGTYYGLDNFEIENIYLTQGYNDDVQFTLDDSAHSQYFEISNTGNFATIRLRSGIPEDVIFNEKFLIFNVLANKVLTVGSNAAVLIRFPTELTEPTVMRFTESYYTGAFEQNEITLSENIVLDTGFEIGTDFELYGDYADHFEISSINNTVQITSNITNILPSEVIEDNYFIILTVEARRERAVSVKTTVIIDIVKEEVLDPVFNQAYYRGLYTENNELEFEEDINLSHGYDETVIFYLEGEQATWFAVANNGNSATLVLESQIPNAVLEENNQLIFTIVALNTNGASGRAVISIDLSRENIGFAKDFYKGYIEDGLPIVETISIQDLFIPNDINSTLSGDHSEYFQVRNEQGNLILDLRTPIPDQILSENNVLILTLEIQIGNNNISTVLVLEVIHTETVLTFEKSYYVGTYDELSGLEFDDEIKVNNVSFETVSFSLQGDDALWFDLDRGENSVELIVIDSIPTDILINTHLLIFEVIADKPNSRPARSTIAISLPKQIPEQVILAFDQINYLGSIENNEATIGPITLSEGYELSVQFSLHGELRDYFEISAQGAAVNITLRTPISEESIPANRIIVLEMQASAPETMPAFATLVYKYVVAGQEVMPVVELIFAQTYYTGSYEDPAGLTFTTPISLAEGYDADVLFSLDGDHSQWFVLSGTGNSQTLVMSSPIPAAVLANNRQLIFVVQAQRPGSTTTESTIVISLTAEYTEGLVLGFDQVSYLGSIENNEATIGPITLSEGYEPGVQFSLHGELRDYFEISAQGAAVNITLRTPISEESIPANRIIVLEMQASAPETMPAFATLVYKYVVAGQEVTPVVELIFAQTYYTGSYEDPAGLTFTTPISLAEGYDADVLFSLDGDHSQWFILSGTGNSQTLDMSSPIPAAVLANNRQLIFVVQAQRPGSTTTEATIVISLTAEYTEGLVLGFDQVSYLGSIENNEATIGPITLSEGYEPGVQFSLHGELRDYFEISAQGAAVNITLRTPISEESIPANRIIVLEMQASAPETMPAFATLVYKYVVAGQEVTPVVELIFAQTYYTGSYEDPAGLTFTTPISLAEGYNADVLFSLDGDHSQWFVLSGTGNSQTLVMSSPIPAAVLANNRQLIFVVQAQRPGSTTTEATIVISLTAEYTEGLVLGFDQVSYLGSIENNEATIGPITLSEGYEPGVQFSLHGELRDYFEISAQGAAVNITLRTPISEESIPANRIIVLEMQASAPETMPAFATLVYKYVVAGQEITPVVELIFAETYYTGSYEDPAGLTFTTPISLAEGYDADVLFSLDGDHSQWFVLSGTGNSQILVMSSPIPAAVLANNRQLIFVVQAQRPGSTTTEATIVISLTAEYTEGLVLGFDQVSYLGSIENNEATIGPITLSEGYEPGVQFSLHGELRDYFEISAQGAAVNITLRTPISEESIPANRIIVLEMQASAPETMPAFATLVYKYVVAGQEITPVVELIFAETYYTGSYEDPAGLTFTTPISLAEGYDADVLFSLDGDHSQWFVLSGTGNSQILVMSSPIPAAVLANNRQLIFVVQAQRPGSTTTEATIVISLTAEYTEGLVLGFDQVSYLGSIENNEATIGPITLSEGYEPGVQFSLHGELRDYFEISAQGAAVNITLRTPISEESIPANRIIVLEMQASAPETMPAFATLVYKYVVACQEVTPVVELIFAQTYYTGSYEDPAGLTFTTPISLAEGYDADVLFSLDGDHSQWFILSGTGNSQTLVMSSPIPAAVLANNRQLIFVVQAQRPGSTTTEATIVISLTAEYTEGLVLGFDQVSYLGSIENNEATIGPITLSEGYEPGVQFSLHGELRDYFEISAQGAAVNITLRTPISEESIPANRIIVLEMQASAPETMPAFATLVYKYVVAGQEVTPVMELIFAHTYYTGSYEDPAGLTFTMPISLAEGYDADVLFSLDGDHSQWFILSGTGNSQTLVISSPIPAAVLANNRQLIFVVQAQRPGSTTTEATIVISLTAEYTEGLVLGFDQVSYLGSIENNEATIGPITLSEGYEPGVQFSLHGELRDYFEISAQGAAVNITLRTPISEESIPANRIIVLEMQASAPETMPAFATLVYKYVVAGQEVTPVVELIFAQTYYTGSYEDPAGLTFTTPISLAEGYNADVLFSLDGDHSQWFVLSGTGNSQTLVMSSPIPAAVLANNRQLIFVVQAQRPGSTTTEATIVISLTAEYTEGLVLGFDQVSYLGSIENNEATIGPITLSEGYEPGVQFSLHGELRDYFEISAQGAAVNITLRTPISEESIPANRIIVLEMQASAPETMPAFATLVYKYVVAGQEITPVVELIFAETYYTGSYEDPAGLTFTTPISLAEGYDADVLFSLDGDHSQWFVLSGTGNSQILVMSSPIPAAVLANNRQLIFVVQAQRPGSTTTEATIVISLTAEYTEGLVLGFDQVSYLGSIENNEATIGPITLSEGYEPGVQFSLHGELRDYFEISAQGAAVNITLRTPISEESIPANRIIVLEMQASAPETMPAFATLVYKYVVAGQEVTPVVELIFAQTYYTGSYEDPAGLTFKMPISLAEGYDADVLFSLDGDHSQWFVLSGTGNSQTLDMSSPIPAAVLANNRQLIFVVQAQRPGSTTTEATIVISLTAEYTEGLVLGFDQVSYLGSIENNEATIGPITLSEGYEPGVQFSLHGELRDYFEISAQGEAVNITLRTPISEESIPANRIIVLEMQASAPETMPAFATLVYKYVVAGQEVTPVVELIFAQTYYTGSYEDPAGLTFTTPISLAEGYNADVLFSLDGDHSQWFVLSGTGNSQILVMSSPIPAAVLANNRQLIFVVQAQRPGSTTTEATIVISLTAEYTEGLVLGFDQVSYLGSIENNEATIGPITLSEGYEPGVQFSLHGELRDYFEISAQGAAVNITLRTPISEESIPANRIIVLEMQASAPETMPAFATLVYKYVVAGQEVTPVVELIFAQTYYTGSYEDPAGLTFTMPISLAEGYDADVLFSLDGDHSQWFVLSGTGNSQTLDMSSPIPAAVLANNRQLIFVVQAQRPGSTTTEATIVISLTAEYTEGLVLGFDQVSYLGSIENNEATIGPITLSEGYEPGVQFSLHGELRDYFEISAQGEAVNITLRTPISEESIPANRIIVLEMQASAPETMPAFATLVYKYVVAGQEVTPVVELIFAQTYYTGSYEDPAGLTFTTPISLAEGYNADVLFSLDGDHSQWFVLSGTGNSQILVMSSPIPAAVLANNRQLIFVVQAQRPGSTTTEATIVISLTAEYTEGLVLGFDQVSYLGSIENNEATIGPITLSEGYEPGVQFSLHGELRDYFEISAQGAAVNITLRTPISEESIPANRIIVLEMQASAPETMPAFATLVYKYVVAGQEVTPVVELIFAQTYYTGSYEDPAGLTFTMPISLAEGYDEDVLFSLDGDHSQWFVLSGTGNSQTLDMSSPIPAAVLANNRQLIFVVQAQRPGSTTTEATIVISLTAEYTEGLVLGFDQVSYLGSIENNEATIGPITLSEGYEPGVQFSLHGELRDYFEISAQGEAVNITLRTPISEESIPANRIIVLEMQASAPETMPAFATLVYKYVVAGQEVTPVVELIFAQTYYTGSYEDPAGLTFTTPISLAEGYDADVLFSLDGDHSQWFILSGTGNSQTLDMSSPIPAAVLANNRQLIFVVQAQRTGSTTTEATIVISLTAEYTEGLVLGFDQVSYLGSIENNEATIGPITLSEGYEPGVQFSLHGELRDYFEISAQGAAVNITLRTPISEESIPANRIIVLEMQASAPETMPAFATLVYKYVVAGQEVTPVVELIFAQTYYTGSYEDPAGLTFTTPISLAEGYDADVLFSLDGDHSQWFILSGTGNSQTLVMSSPIPAAVLANNRQLIFVVQAQRPGSTTTEATIVISLTAEYTEGLVLGFDQVSYLGSIENNEATIGPITLSEGYEPGVQFSLHGVLRDYFEISAQGAAVNITLRTPISEESIPANRIIVLEMQASAPETMPAFATLVYKYVVAGQEVTPVVELIFAQTYYTGSYEDPAGLTFTTPISLAEGYDADVLFSLDGDHSQWFVLSGTGNSQTLDMSSPIPAAVLANNRQLIFVVQAQRLGSTTTEATIVISLTAEYTEGLVLGFDQVSYLGSIENNEATIGPITLSEGYEPGVQFSLHGELRDYFEISAQGAAVNITLRTPISEESIPANRIIVLEMQASAPETMPAFATLVYKYVVAGQEVTPVVELIFAQTYYTGSYEDPAGLTFTTPISLAEGYDADVLFSLDGDHSQWFILSGTGNSQTLVMSSPIPAAVLANNRQLIFVVQAQRPGSTTTEATIVISLTAEYTEGLVLGFDQVSYLGSIENNEATIGPITLSEGYEPGVQFSLHGELRDYFEISAQGAAVNITLRTPISEESIPANRIIVTEMQASAPETMPAFATLVYKYVVAGQEVTPVVELIFAQTYYTGSYEDPAGLTFMTPISLAEGYDADVLFSLDGDHSQWFVLSGTGNSQTLVMSSPIPAAVLANNRQLIFVVQAKRPGSTTTEATIVISLTAEDVPTPTGPVVTFSSTSYAVRVEITDTGVVGQVQASADNGEELRYSLQGVNVHLGERLSINDVGELYLSAPVNSGLYTFQVVATTIFTQETAAASVHLSVDANMPPLIVLDRDEEEPHYNLIETYEGCHFELVNHWPLDQEWVYVNETGLHTTAIDREHESIAFMTLSQVQVEVTLHCETDETRVKRSLSSESDPYDYGASKWVLTDTILYNSRRSMINLIVNDINDNAPVFVGKEQEPIVVGYPTAELEGKVLPRSLAELHATDADIGENAALLYWSSEPELAVAPLTGFVHIRDGIQLENEAQLTVHATDQNGQGLTGSIDILVRLLDESNIIVVTVRDAFLDSETDVLTRLSEAVGYEVKVLRSLVVSDDETHEEAARKKREVTSATGASLQLYVYGLIDREPVSIERLITDITSAEVAVINIASTVSLDDHLAAQEIGVVSGRDTGLLAATIVLSVLLFIVMVLIAVYFFLRWRREQKYDEFTDTNSIASQNQPDPKLMDVMSKPRLNIEELRKSEKRLQEMLDAPIQEVTATPTSSRQDAVLDMPPPSDPNALIVIQTTDKLNDANDELYEDEFGERKTPKRKSVVTFNENVKKIIHVEDPGDAAEAFQSSDFEIYKL